MEVRLINIHTKEEWQCAYLAIEHGEENKWVTLEFEDSEGRTIELAVLQHDAEQRSYTVHRTNTRVQGSALHAAASARNARVRRSGSQ